MCTHRLPAKLTRRPSHILFESSREIAFIIEAYPGSNLTDRVLFLQKQFFRPFHAQFIDILARCRTDLLMEHFDEMDTNHDGKITSAEISAFGYEASKQEKIDEYYYKKATNMSTFYGSESSSDVDSYSMLSYRYKNYNK